jgi:4-amino-4-deoxy-L-arabinose transferase-like glycosyltransferase
LETPRDKPIDRRYYVAAFCLAAVLGLAGLNAHWRFQPDSAVFLSAARSLVEGRGYVYNFEPLTRYAPGFPLLLAAVGKVAGMPETAGDSFLALNTAVTLLGLGAVAILFLILRELKAPERVVFFAVLFFAVSRTLHYYSQHLMSDAPFTFLALLALWLGLKTARTQGRKSWAWCGGCAAAVLAASMVRPLGPLLVPAVLAGLWLRKGRREEWPARAGQSLLLALATAVPLLIWSRWTHAAAPNASFHYTQHVSKFPLFENLFILPFTRFMKHMEGLSNGLVGTDAGGAPALLALPFLAAGLARSIRRERMLSAWALLNIAAILACGYDLRRRYLLPVLPVLYAWLVLGFGVVRDEAARRFPTLKPAHLRAAARVGVILVVGLNLGRTAKVVYEARRPDFYAVDADGRMADYGPVTDRLREHAPREAVLLGDEPSVLHYFTRRKVRDELARTGKNPLPEVIRDYDIGYIVLDAREADYTDAVRDLMAERPNALRFAAETGEVRVVEVNPRAFSEGASEGD